MHYTARIAFQNGTPGELSDFFIRGGGHDVTGVYEPVPHVSIEGETAEDVAHAAADFADALTLRLQGMSGNETAEQVFAALTAEWNDL